MSDDKKRKKENEAIKLKKKRQITVLTSEGIVE